MRNTISVHISGVEGDVTLTGDPDTVRTCVEQYVRKCAWDTIEADGLDSDDDPSVALMQAIVADPDYFRRDGTFPDIESIDEYVSNDLQWENTTITVL